jgi:hypothetical protein
MLSWCRPAPLHSISRPAIRCGVTVRTSRCRFLADDGRVVRAAGRRDDQPRRRLPGRAPSPGGTTNPAWSSTNAPPRRQGNCRSQGSGDTAWGDMAGSRTGQGTAKPSLSAACWQRCSEPPAGGGQVHAADLQATRPWAAPAGSRPRPPGRWSGSRRPAGCGSAGAAGCPAGSCGGRRTREPVRATGSARSAEADGGGAGDPPSPPAWLAAGPAPGAGNRPVHDEGGDQHSGRQAPRTAPARAPARDATATVPMAAP